VQGVGRSTKDNIVLNIVQYFLNLNGILVQMSIDFSYQRF
jgi:hypothetical protein